MNTQQVLTQSHYSQALTTNKLIRNTYLLLALTLLFSAVMAGASVVLNLPYPGMLITLAGYFLLLFLTTRFRNSALGLVFVFALTGFMGITLGPIINIYLHHFTNGAQLVAMALGGTGIIFVGLSGYALTSRRNFSFLGGFVTAGVLVAFLAGIAAVFFHLQGLALAVSSMFVLLMSAMILWQTSEIVHGGESNYITATVSLYVSIFNLFTSLLQLLGFSFGDE